MPWRTIQLLNVYLKLRDISQEDIRRALKDAGHELSSAQVSRIVQGGQGAKPEYVDVIVKMVGIPREELWSDVDPEVVIDKVRQAAKESAKDIAAGNPLPSPIQPVTTPAMVDTAAEAALHSTPDYSRAEAAKLRVIRSISYQGPGAIERAIAPQRLAASPPESIDSSEEGSVSIPKRESEAGNAPLWPVKVFGTSMNRRIPPGAIVFYRRSSRPKQDRIVIACVHGDPPTMKWLRGEKLEPDSTDQTISIDLAEDAEFIGEVVAIHIPSSSK